jgi:hypothetical protein
LELSSNTNPSQFVNAPDTDVRSELPMPLSPTAVISPVPWSPATSIGFRIAFLYFCLNVLGGNGTLFRAFPVVGFWIDRTLNWPFHHLSEIAGQNLFHLTGIAAHWHPSESGDTTMNWIQNGLFLIFALAGGILWTFISLLSNKPRTEYRTLHAWLWCARCFLYQFE